LKHGIADLSDPKLNDRISELKATRDQAHLAAERAQDAIERAGTEYHISGACAPIAAATAAITSTRSPNGTKSIRKNCPSWNPRSHVIGNGAQVSEAGLKLGVEGMVSKQVDEPYLPGNRGVWVKTKFLNRQEFVIVGCSDPEGSRSSLGSLLLGYYTDDGTLIHAGRAGTGGHDDGRRAAAEHHPLWHVALLSRVHWVRPELVAEVTYLTWTADGPLRHVVYEGLREDKPAREVRRVD
jgi:hypothetical protein